MSDFIQTKTIKDRLGCPKCDYEFYVIRHKAAKVSCKKCGWEGSFHYLDEEE